MSETERTVQNLMEMTDLRPKFNSINLSGSLGVYVPNPLASLSAAERAALAAVIRSNLLRA